MIYSGSVDARAVAECRELGQLGSNVVASTINAFFQSFILVEVANTPFSTARIIEELEMFSDWNIKNRIKASIKKMRIENRIQSILFPDSLREDQDVHSLVIDFLIDRVNHVLCRSSEERDRSQFCKLQEYPSSKFEERRNTLAVRGISKSKGDCCSKAFLDELLVEILKWTDKISIIDYSIGENWCNPEGRTSANYPPALVDWCIYLVSLNRQIHVDLHTSGGYRGIIQDEIDSLTNESHVNFSVIKHERSKMPHYRFVYAGGFLINIDPGIDLFRDGRVKDISARLADDIKALALVSRSS